MFIIAGSGRDAVSAKFRMRLICSEFYDDIVLYFFDELESRDLCGFSARGLCWRVLGDWGPLRLVRARVLTPVVSGGRVAITGNDNHPSVVTDPQ